MRGSYSMNNKQQGFTLIELMIVVTIIGVLFTIALPTYQNYTRKAQLAAVVAELEHAKRGFELATNSGQTPSWDPNDSGWIGMVEQSSDGACRFYDIQSDTSDVIVCLINRGHFARTFIIIGSRSTSSTWTCMSASLPPKYKKYIKLGNMTACPE